MPWMPTITCVICLGAGTPATAQVVAAPAEVQAAEKALDAWQLEEAHARAEAILFAAPRDPAAQLLAAEVLHQTGHFNEALALWRSAGPAESDRARALGPRLVASAGYAKDFVATTTPHFTILAGDKDVIVATYAADVLESAYAGIGQALEFLPAERGHRIVVEIYPDAPGLAGATGLTVKEIETSGTIAVCKFHRLMIISPLATLDGYAWADTLAHEFVHLVVSKSSHNAIPVWLHEGIAKYFESCWRGRAGEPPSPYSQHLLQRAARDETLVPLAKMHPSMAKLSSQREAALAFAEVFEVIDFVVRRQGMAAIAALLHRAGEGVPWPLAMAQTWHMEPAELERAWLADLKQRYAKPAAKSGDAAQPRPDVVRLGTSDVGADAPKPLEPMDDKEVHDWARLGELLQLRLRPRAAIVEYEKAVAKSDAHYATLVGQLARAYIDVDDLSAADAILRRCLAQHPGDSDAHLLAGRIARKQRRWSQAQSHYERAREVNPFNPEIHTALADLYGRANLPQRKAQEEHFAHLCMQPRRRGHHAAAPAETPPLRQGFGALRALSRHWTSVRLDGGTPRDTPIWDLPLEAGTHQLTTQLTTAPGRKVVVEAGQIAWVTLDP